MAHYLSSPTSLVLLAAAIAAACTRAQQTPGALPPQPPRSAPVAASVGTASSPKVPAATWPEKTYYREVSVRGRRIFYREAGRTGAPVLVLLHGYPSSSHTYRELIPLLSGRYHVYAPDYLGSGYSDRPDPAEFAYTFDTIADHVTAFLEALSLSRYVLYLQDFGAPVGFRIALAHPERLRALIVQNGNAYLDGLTEQRRAFFRRARDDRSPEGERFLADLVSERAIIDRQYLRDVPGDKRGRMSPDSWTHDLAFLRSDRDRQIQMQLFRDYQTNIDAYPTWQAFLRKHQPPTLIVWGEHDPAFVAAGARAYLRDVPQAEVHLIDAGHFAVEEQPTLIAQHVAAFLDRIPTP